MAIELKPDESIRRTELHAKYGGRRQGGISPSRVGPYVFLITAVGGQAYGYIYDGRSDEDGFFHYTGEGQVGDQRMTQGNRAIRDHEAEGRELHLFEAHGTELEYIGEFRYHDDYQADAPDLSVGPLRKVIVFRLEQISGTDSGPRRTRLERLGSEPVKEIPLEQSITERTLVAGSREPYEAERREQKLVLSFGEYLEGQGHEICRLQFSPPGEAALLFCDLFDKTTGTIYESKGTVTRAAVRMAVGQLADYARLVEPRPERAILLPERPRDDLLALAASENIGVVWPESGRFDGASSTSGRELVVGSS